MNLSFSQQKSALYVTIFTVLIYVLISAFTHSYRLTQPTDWDSLHYHLPIAHQFLLNLNLFPADYPLYYYPATAHFFLAPFLIPSTPTWLPNLFNPLTLIVLFFISHHFARHLQLSSLLSFLYALIIVTLIPVLRLLPTQIIDLWLLIFFLLTLTYLHSPLNRRSTYLTSLFLGLFISTKLTALPITLFLLFFYFRRFFKSWLRYPLSFLLFITISSIWYLRNFLLTNNPFYPGSLSLGPLHLVGHPLLHYLNHHLPLHDLLTTPTNFFLLLNGLISEYHIWLLLALFYLIFIRPKNSPVKSLFYLGCLICLLYFITPAFLHNIYHDLRYMLPGISLIILSLFLYLNHNQPFLLYLACMFSLFAAAAFIPYYPKALLLSFTVSLPLLPLSKFFLSSS